MIDLVKAYIEKRLQLAKLEIVGIIANVSAGMVHVAFIFLLAMFIWFMFSIALGFYLGQVFNSNALGFAAVGLIYTLVFLVYIAISKTKVESAVKDKVVKLAFDNEEGKKKN